MQERQERELRELRELRLHLDELAQLVDVLASAGRLPHGLAGASQRLTRAPMSHLLLRRAPHYLRGARFSSNTTGGLPYRIRAPLAKLQEKKKTSAEPAKAQQPMLGDGEQLEAGTTGPDYMRLALTSRKYRQKVNEANTFYSA